MAIPIIENAANIWRQVPMIREAYDLRSHENMGTQWGRGWTRAGAVGDDDLAGVDRYELMEQAYKAYRKDPRARNIVETYVTYIIGDGFFVNFPNESDSREWEKFKEENRFGEKFPDAVRLTLVRGNHFFRVFDADFQTSQIRHLSGTQIGEIKSADGDPERILQYIGRDKYYKKTFDPEQIIHMRVFPFGQKWGHSLLEPILQSLARKRSYENSQSTMLKVLASIPIIRRGPWTTQQIEAMSNKFVALPPPGTVVTAGKMEEWGAPDHPAYRMNWKDQGRSLDLGIASGAGLPYFMAFNDSSDSNYSATLVAEAPAMRRFKELQKAFAFSLGQLVQRVIEPAEFSVEFYPIVPRDTYQEVRAWTEPMVMNYISWRTYMERVGIDPEEEEERLKNEGLWSGRSPGARAQQEQPEGQESGFQWRSPVKDKERESTSRAIGAQTPTS